MEKIDEVLKFLAPHIRFITSLMANHDFTELGLVRKRIENGIKEGFVRLYPEDENLNIDLKEIEKGKGKDWTKLLIEQLKILIDIIEKFENTI